MLPGNGMTLMVAQGFLLLVMAVLLLMVVSSGSCSLHSCAHKKELIPNEHKRIQRIDKKTTTLQQLNKMKAKYIYLMAALLATVSAADLVGPPEDAVRSRRLVRRGGRRGGRRRKNRGGGYQKQRVNGIPGTSPNPRGPGPAAPVAYCPSGTVAQYFGGTCVAGGGMGFPTCPSGTYAFSPWTGSTRVVW